MTPKRRKELNNNFDLKLTKEELDQSYRFCCEWDGLLIHKDEPEADCCHCLKEVERQPINQTERK